MAATAGKLKKHMPMSRQILRRLLWLVVVAVFATGFFSMLRNNKPPKSANSSNFPNYLDSKDRKLGLKNLASRQDAPFEVGCRVPDTAGPRANASFVMLARNSELDGVIKSMKSMERHFNQWFDYPWIFLNDEEFEPEFKETVKKHTKGKVEFGLVPAEHWDFPKDLDPDMVDEYIQSQGDRGIMYGNMALYHKMCRFYSGHFYSHPLVRKLEWYWRVEPDVQFFCDMTYDPFIEMERNNKKYGFTVSIEELFYTAPSLFRETKAYIRKNGIAVGSAWDIMVAKFGQLQGDDAELYPAWSSMADLKKQVFKNANLRHFMDKTSKTDADLKPYMNLENIRDIFELSKKKPAFDVDRFDNEEYNLCHFWTNFEIAKTEIFLLDTYQNYFKHLEEAGGFYKERWGDAPVHSLAIGMMLNREEIHYFRDVGYKHSTLGHCPRNAPGKQLPYRANGFKDDAPKHWSDIFKNSKPDAPAKNGVGCRCSCPRKFRELEDNNLKCIKRFAEVLSDNYKPRQKIRLAPLENEALKKIQAGLAQGKDVGHDSKNT